MTHFMPIQTPMSLNATPAYRVSVGSNPISTVWLFLQVVSLELMTANGEIMHCSRRQNKEIFLSALCSLGAVGIILTVTWQCEKAFRLLQLSEPKPLEEV